MRLPVVCRLILGWSFITIKYQTYYVIYVNYFHTQLNCSTSVKCFIFSPENLRSKFSSCLQKVPAADLNIHKQSDWLLRQEAVISNNINQTTEEGIDWTLKQKDTSEKHSRLSNWHFLYSLPILHISCLTSTVASVTQQWISMLNGFLSRRVQKNNTGFFYKFDLMKSRCLKKCGSRQGIPFCGQRVCDTCCIHTMKSWVCMVWGSLQ